MKRKIDFKKLNGLIPAIAQDYKTKEVLMLGFMDKKALEKTLETKKATYWSRSRKKYWVKGEESGNFQIVKNIWLDCDNDSILLKVKQEGRVCHTGSKTCFFKKL